MNTHRMEITRILPADPERIFRAWTNSEELKAWHCPEGMTVSWAECEPRVGGRYAINMVDPEGIEHRAVGEYLEMVPGEKLVMSWDWEVGGGGDQGTRVTVLMKAIAEGRSEMTLIHELFNDFDSCEGHREGWTGALNNLETHLQLP